MAETLLMVLLVAIASYVACFKLSSGPAPRPYVAWIPERREEEAPVTRV